MFFSQTGCAPPRPHLEAPDHYQVGTRQKIQWQSEVLKPEIQGICHQTRGCCGGSYPPHYAGRSLYEPSCHECLGIPPVVSCTQAARDRVGVGSDSPWEKLGLRTRVPLCLRLGSTESFHPPHPWQEGDSGCLHRGSLAGTEIIRK